MKLVSSVNNLTAMELVKKYSPDKIYPIVAEHYTLYDTVYADESITFFTKGIGSHYLIRQRSNPWPTIIMSKTLADTNMECDGMLPLSRHVIVTSLEVEENYGKGYCPLNTRGYLTLLVGSVAMVSLPTDIGEDQMPTIYIPPQRNFCVTLGGEVIARDSANGIRYRCRLRGVMARELQ